MGTLKIIWQGFLAMPLWVKLWIAVLVVSNGILPLYFLDQLVAQITLLGICSSSVVGFYIVKAVGFNKLMGLMHATWIPMVYVQAYTLLTSDVSGAFGDWLMASFIISLISLAFDVYDVVVYTNQTAKPKN